MGTVPESVAVQMMRIVRQSIAIVNGVCSPSVREGMQRIRPRYPPMARPLPSPLPLEFAAVFLYPPVFPEQNPGCSAN